MDEQGYLLDWSKSDKWWTSFSCSSNVLVISISAILILLEVPGFSAGVVKILSRDKPTK